MLRLVCITGNDHCLSQCYMATLMKENISLGLAYRFRGLVHYCYGRKHGSTQVDMVLERSQEFYIWIIWWQEERNTGHLAWTSETSKPAPSDTFTQQNHIYSNKATPPNSVPP